LTASASGVKNSLGFAVLRGCPMEAGAAFCAAFAAAFAVHPHVASSTLRWARKSRAEGVHDAVVADDHTARSRRNRALNIAHRHQLLPGNINTLRFVLHLPTSSSEKNLYC